MEIETKAKATIGENESKQDRTQNSAPAITKLKRLAEEGNPLVTAEMPYENQKAEIARMKTDVEKGNICYGKVIAVEVSADNTEVRMVLKRDTIRVIVPAHDFFAHSSMKDIEAATAEERFTRYRRKGSHMLGAAVSFIPKMMGEDEQGVPFVVASRKEAMDIQQEKHFFSEKADAQVGSTTKASIVSAGPRYVTVECLGVESVIGTGGLSAFNYIEKADDEFHPGMGLVVAIEKLDVDKENHTIKEIVFSHALVERHDAKVETANERMLNGRYMAQVVATIAEYYVVIITGLKIRGLIPKNAYLGTDPLIMGDTVSMLVTGINKDRNMVIGKCMKV